jgi:hypothetical protein
LGRVGRWAEGVWRGEVVVVGDAVDVEIEEDNGDVYLDVANVERVGKMEDEVAVGTGVTVT